MTHWLSCRGCVHDGPECPHRQAMRKKLRGLNVTSIRWRCAEREDRYRTGDAVWADTVSDYGAPVEPWENEPPRDWYPGHVVKLLGAKVLVHIARDAEGRDHGADYPFSPRDGSQHGFCKIPLSRITEREAAPSAICPECDVPACHGHQKGYSCGAPADPVPLELPVQ